MSYTMSEIEDLYNNFSEDEYIKILSEEISKEIDKNSMKILLRRFKIEKILHDIRKNKIERILYDDI